MARELGQRARDVREPEDKFTVELRVSRQDYEDVYNAWVYSRQNDKIKPLTLRLGKLAEQLREALDKAGAPRADASRGNDGDGKRPRTSGWMR